MLSFSQFTRRTLLGEFAWLGAIIFEEILWWGGNFPGGSFPRKQLSGGKLSGGQSSKGHLSGGQFSLGEVVRTPSVDNTQEIGIEAATAGVL